MLENLMNQTCEILTTSYNKYGEQEEESATEVSCRFRQITQADQSNNMEELMGMDAMLWLEASTEVEEGTLVRVEGFTWRIVKLVLARATGAEVKFKKCFLEKYSEGEEDAS